MGTLGRNDRIIADESASVIDEAKKATGDEAQESAKLAGLSDERLKECKNALELQKLRDKQERNRKTEDEKATQDSATYRAVERIKRTGIYGGFGVCVIIFASSILFWVYSATCSGDPYPKLESVAWSVMLYGFGLITPSIRKVFESFFGK